MLWHFVICDDEENSRQKVKNLFCKILQQLKVSERSYEITQLTSLAQLQLYPQEPDILLLDIAFQAKNSGLLAAMQLRARWGKAIIIFVTSMSAKNYIRTSIRASTTGYVEKQYLEKQLPTAVCDAIRSLKQLPPPSPKINFQFNAVNYAITVDNILYVASEAHKLYLHMMKAENGVNPLQYTGTIRKEAERLSEFGFLRVHKSFIVNLYNVANLEDKNIILLNGEAVIYNIKRRKEIRDQLDNMQDNLLNAT